MTALYLPLGRSASRTISTRFATVRRAPMPLTGVSAEFCGHALRSRSVLRICVISSCRVFNNAQVVEVVRIDCARTRLARRNRGFQSRAPPKR